MTDAFTGYIFLKSKSLLSYDQPYVVDIYRWGEKHTPVFFLFVFVSAWLLLYMDWIQGLPEGARAHCYVLGGMVRLMIPTRFFD